MVCVCACACARVCVCVCVCACHILSKYFMVEQSSVSPGHVPQHTLPRQYRQEHIRAYLLCYAMARRSLQTGSCRTADKLVQCKPTTEAAAT